MEPPVTRTPFSPTDTELTDQYCFSVVVEQEKGTWRSKQTFITFTRYFFSLRPDNIAKNAKCGTTHWYFDSQFQNYYEEVLHQFFRLESFFYHL